MQAQQKSAACPGS